MAGAALAWFAVSIWIRGKLGLRRE
jgi:hypothetical protein